MAKVLAQNFSIDLGQVVRNSVSAVKTVRRREQARKEAEFQRSIADGLSYQEQLKLRESWLKEEKESNFPDSEYISTLEKSITDTKKLNRFQKFREKHVSILRELNSGKINEERYLKTLEKQLEGVTDPELRLEIQDGIAGAEKQVKNYRDTVLSNQVTLAQNDGTAKVLKEAISRVNSARANASIGDNEDEVLDYDNALIALNSQLNTVRIEDSITNFQTKSSTLGVSPIEKLDFINSQFQNADSESAFRFGEKTYNSAQDFWSLQRDQYLAGNSELLGGNFFEELNVFTDGKIARDNAKFGFTTKRALDDVLNQYNQLAGKPELTPFLVNLENSRVSSLNGVVLPDQPSVRAPITATPDGTPTSSVVSAPTPTTPSPVTAPTAPVTPAPGVPPATEPPPTTPQDGAVPEVPAQPDGSAERPFPGQPLETPISGIGTRSSDGKFIFTQSGWQPISLFTPIGDISIPAPASVPISSPASVPISTPEPVSLLRNEPVGTSATTTPGAQSPQFSPVTGIGTRSEDGRFIFTSAGWQPVLAPINISPSENLANPFQGFNNLFGGNKQKTPQANPTPTVAPTPAPQPPPTPTVREHVVVAGDTLSAIAKRNKTTVAKIAEENEIDDPNKINVGQRLRL